MKIEKNILIIAIVVVVLVGGLAFWGGMAYGKSQVAATGAQRFGQRNGGGGARGAGFSGGSIIAKDATSITIQIPNNGSKIILYSGSTQIGKSVSGTPADLQVGQNVMVTGQTNSDGSITAQSIQIRPADANRPAAPAQQ